MIKPKRFLIYDQSKRKKSAPHHLCAYVAHSSSPSPPPEMDNKAELSHLYYEAVDSVVEATLRRFHQEDLEKLEAVEPCLLAAVNKDVPLKEIRAKLKGLPSIIIQTLWWNS